MLPSEHLPLETEGKQTKSTRAQGTLDLRWNQSFCYTALREILVTIHINIIVKA